MLNEPAPTSSMANRAASWPGSARSTPAGAEGWAVAVGCGHGAAAPGADATQCCLSPWKCSSRTSSEREMKRSGGATIFSRVTCTEAAAACRGSRGGGGGGRAAGRAAATPAAMAGPLQSSCWTAGGLSKAPPAACAQPLSLLRSWTCSIAAAMQLHARLNGMQWLQACRKMHRGGGAGAPCCPLPLCTASDQPTALGSLPAQTSPTLHVLHYTSGRASNAAGAATLKA